LATANERPRETGLVKIEGAQYFVPYYNKEFKVLNTCVFNDSKLGGKMKSYFKMCVVFTVVVFASMAIVSVGLAKETKSFKEATVDAGRTTVNYPANVLNESVNVVDKATKGTVGAVVDTVKATGETLTGDVHQAPEMVKQPVMGTVETVKDAVVGTVETPIKAGEKTVEQNQN